jgi:hypothetical protein
MNMRRGFWRLWIVVSAVWVAVILMRSGGLLNEEGKTPPVFWSEARDGRAAGKELPDAQAAAAKATAEPLDIYADDFATIQNQRIQSAKELALVEARIRRGMAAERDLLTLGQLTFGPPVILLALGLGIGWAVSGFRRR